MLVYILRASSYEKNVLFFVYKTYKVQGVFLALQQNINISTFTMVTYLLDKLIYAVVIFINLILKLVYIEIIFFVIIGFSRLFEKSLMQAVLLLQ